MNNGFTAQVEYAYVAQKPGELNLAVGDLITKCLQKKDGKINKNGMFSIVITLLIYS